MSDAEVVEDETRLAKEWERDEAVDWSCDCMVLEVWSRGVGFWFVFVSDLGLDSVFKRRSTPETAYEIGYVKYEDERVDVKREGGEDDGKEDCVESVEAGMERGCDYVSELY
jgi:hypothetical protein